MTSPYAICSHDGGRLGSVGCAAGHRQRAGSKDAEHARGDVGQRTGDGSRSEVSPASVAAVTTAGPTGTSFCEFPCKPGVNVSALALKRTFLRVDVTCGGDRPCACPLSTLHPLPKCRCATRRGSSFWPRSACRGN